MTVHPLPERPNLDQLRRHAKELRTAARHGEAEALADRHPAGMSVSLAAAQLVVAASTAVELAAAQGAVERLMTRTRRYGPSCGCAPHRSCRPAADGRPVLATNDIWTATSVGRRRAGEQAAGPRPVACRAGRCRVGVDALLVACNSVAQIEPARQPGLVEVAETLLDAGADPNTSVGAVPEFGHCSALAQQLGWRTIRARRSAAEAGRGSGHAGCALPRRIPPRPRVPPAAARSRCPS